MNNHTEIYILLPDVGTLSEGAISTHVKSLPQS